MYTGSLTARRVRAAAIWRDRVQPSHRRRHRARWESTLIVKCIVFMFIITSSKWVILWFKGEIWVCLTRPAPTTWRFWEAYIFGTVFPIDKWSLLGSHIPLILYETGVDSLGWLTCLVRSDKNPLATTLQRLADCVQIRCVLWERLVSANAKSGGGISAGTHVQTPIRHRWFCKGWTDCGKTCCAVRDPIICDRSNFRQFFTANHMAWRLFNVNLSRKIFWKSQNILSCQIYVGYCTKSTYDGRQLYKKGQRESAAVSPGAEAGVYISFANGCGEGRGRLSRSVARRRCVGASRSSRPVGPTRPVDSRPTSRRRRTDVLWSRDVLWRPATDGRQGFEGRPVAAVRTRKVTQQRSWLKRTTNAVPTDWSRSQTQSLRRRRHWTVSGDSEMLTVTRKCIDNCFVHRHSSSANLLIRNLTYKDEQKKGNRKRKLKYVYNLSHFLRFIRPDSLEKLSSFLCNLLCNLQLMSAFWQ